MYTMYTIIFIVMIIEALVFAYSQKRNGRCKKLVSPMNLPKALEHYAHLTNGGKVQLNISKEESCVALKIHDHGMGSLDEHEEHVLHVIMAKLKDQIVP